MAKKLKLYDNTDWFTVTYWYTDPFDGYRKQKKVDVKAKNHAKASKDVIESEKKNRPEVVSVYIH